MLKLYAGNGRQDQRMIASVMTAFGLAALLLTAIGLYALLAYYVAGRTREIGIRMASRVPSPAGLGTWDSAPAAD